jgi:MFS family permease
MTPQRLTMAVFFVQPLAFGAWLPRIPDVQQHLGLGPAGLSLALLGLPVGILLTLPFAGRLVGRTGPRTAIFYGFIAFVVAVALPVWAWNTASLFVALMLTGSSMSTLELGLNVMADSVEKRGGRIIMSTCHGFWSLGMMCGSLIGSGLAALHVAPHWAMPLLSVVLLPVSLVVAAALPAHTPEPETEQPASPTRLALPDPLLLGICVFALGIAMTEGAMADWSAVFLRDDLAAGPGIAGIGYTVFALLVAAGRFTGDYLKKRYGPVPLARACGACAIVGLGAVLLAPNTPLAIAAFGVVGIGVSVGFPLAVTAAAGVPGRPAAISVATLSFISLIGFLVGPPLIGFVAQAAGLRTGLSTLLVPLLLSLMLAGMLRPRNARSNTTAPAAPPLPVIE